MPLYIDIHRRRDDRPVDTVIADHATWLQPPADRSTRMLRYWVGKDDGTVFCLIEATDRSAARRIHDEHDGEIVEVIEGS